MEGADPKTRLVIGITGLLGAGKTTAAQYLASRYSFNYIRYSQVLADWFNEDPDRKPQLQVVGWEVMSSGLQAELNRRLISRISSHGDWCVDGLRDPLDYESLKNNFTSAFHLIYIECPQQERFSRLQKKCRVRTFEEFCAADTHPVEQRIQLLRQFAEICVTNRGPIKKLQVKLTEFMTSLRKENA